MKKEEEVLAVAHQVLEYAEKLSGAAKAPDIPAPFAEDARFLQYHENSLKLREIILAFSKGDLSPVIDLKGFTAGACKSLQANLRHMTWVVQQIESGDYTQRVDFLGEFSKSLNSMTIKLKTTIDDLHQKEEALTTLAVTLQEEAKRRSVVMSELKKSEQRFKMLADHDPLTNLFNRRAFFSCAEVKVKKANSLKQQCCVCLLDVDYFKRFNDTYGHVEGDRALQHVAQVCQNKLRLTDDIMGRYGGEEFIIFFSMNAERTYEAAERIRQAIEENCFHLEGGDTTKLTASFGISVILPDDGSDYAEKLRFAIAQADTALYTAKSEGRNRVCLASIDTPTMSYTAARKTV